MKILIGYDGTPAAEAVLRDLEKAGLPADTQACLLVAIPPVAPADVLSADPMGSPWLPANAAIGEEKERGDASLEIGRKGSESLRARFAGWEIKVEARFETPAQSLLEFAEAWKPDMIAVGSHGWSWLGRTFLGSTAEKVLAHAKMNVRLCHPRESRNDAPPRILVAVDGSADAGNAVTEIGNRNWPAGTRIKLVAAREYFAWTEAMAKTESYGKRGQAEDPRRWTWMEGYLNDTVTRFKAHGLDATAAILEGDPRHVLLTEAESFQADCICMGRRGVTGFKRLLLGSVSGAVASHAPCSVEIIHQPIVG
jgi:nucleotide-binding universal stress UspA family protein